MIEYAEFQMIYVKTFCWYAVFLNKLPTHVKTSKDMYIYIRIMYSTINISKEIELSLAFFNQWYAGIEILTF